MALTVKVFKGLIVASSVFLFLAPVKAEDVIYRKGGANPLKVDQVTFESYEEVRYKKSGTPPELKLSADKVASVVYGDEPEAYKNGLNFFNNYDYENAVSSFKLAMETKNGRKWIKTYSLFWIAKSYQAWGNANPEKLKDAVKAYNDLLSADPKTRFYPEVLLNLAICYSKSGDHGSALQTLERLGKDAYEKKMGVVWEARAKHEKAQADLRAGLLDDAERDFRSSETFCEEQAGKTKNLAVAAELKRLSGLDRLSQGAVLIKKKKYQEAKNFFDGILNDSSSSLEALAGAQNGLGECSLAQKNLKDAQIEFAVAKVKYGVVKEEAAKATYYLGICCLELKDKEPMCKKKAQDYFQEVVDYYGETSWAKKARKMLK